MKFFHNHWKKIVLLFICGIVIFPHLYILKTTYFKIHTLKSVFVQHSFPEKYIPEDISVAIVFGAAAWRTGPSDVFADRLTVAYELYEKKKITKILISGDNSAENYNEPESGKKYLREKGIPESDIVLDYAGFRTYDTCVRANKIWGINKAFLITQRFHLPRAIFTCKQNGIESIGISSSLQPYKNHWKNIFRETLAQQKAFYEVLFFSHDPKFLGDEEEL